MEKFNKAMKRLKVIFIDIGKWMKEIISNINNFYEKEEIRGKIKHKHLYKPMLNIPCKLKLARNKRMQHYYHRGNR